MSASVLGSRAGRALTLIPRHGLAGTAERLRRWIVSPLIQRLYLDESHVWYTVAIAQDGDVLPDGFELRRGHQGDLPALAAIGGIAVSTGTEYLRRGAEMYVITNGDALAFSTWIHVDAVPLAAARGGWLGLPEKVVSLEDSLVAPDFRTTRIAMKAIDAITARQGDHDVDLIITRIAQDNTVARKWARRCGGTEVATMRRRRIGPFRRVSVTPLPGGEDVASMLAGRLN